MIDEVSFIRSYLYRTMKSFLTKFTRAIVSRSVFASLCLSVLADSSHPNIVYILADDMGYGDVQALNPENGKIPTPHMDKLIAEGMSFTDAHTCSSVCTPTRYGLLTGRYNWRTRKQGGVLNGTSAPLIPTSRTTVANLLKDAGYKTAMVGKWHLGLGLPKKGKRVDWKGEIEGGPVDLGFDYFRRGFRPLCGEISGIHFRPERGGAILPLYPTYLSAYPDCAYRKVEGEKRDWRLW